MIFFLVLTIKMASLNLQQQTNKQTNKNTQATYAETSVYNYLLATFKAENSVYKYLLIFF